MYSYSQSHFSSDLTQDVKEWVVHLEMWVQIPPWEVASLEVHSSLEHSMWK